MRNKGATETTHRISTDCSNNGLSEVRDLRPVFQELVPVYIDNYDSDASGELGITRLLFE